MGAGVCVLLCLHLLLLLLLLPLHRRMGEGSGGRMLCFFLFLLCTRDRKALVFARECVEKERYRYLCPVGFSFSRVTLVWSVQPVIIRSYEHHLPEVRATPRWIRRVRNALRDAI